MKRYLSVWLPYWPIERLQRVRSELVPCNRAFVLVESGARGTRITAANSAALRDGAVPGMPLADARVRLPELMSDEADPASDAVGLESLARWCARYGMAFNSDGADGVWIDISGVAHLYGGEDTLREDVLARLRRFGLSGEAAIAGTYGAAWALARFFPLSSPVSSTPLSRLSASRSQRTRSTSAAGAKLGRDGEHKEYDERARLAGLPVEALRLSPEVCRLLRRLGLKRIGQLEDLPRVALKRRFPVRGTGDLKPADLTEAVVERLDQLFGRRAEPLNALAEVPAYEARRAFSEPLISHDGIETALAGLARELCACLAGRHAGLRRSVLRLDRSDNTFTSLAVGTSRASRAPDHLMRLFRPRLDAVDAGFGIDVMTLSAFDIESLHPGQGDLVEIDRAGIDSAGTRTTPDRENAYGDLVDRLANRLGCSRVFQLEPQPSHWPERMDIEVQARPAFSVGRRHGNPMRKDRSQTGTRTTKRTPTHEAARPMAHPQIELHTSGALTTAPRPSLLLRPPEPIAVVAEVPEGPPHAFRWRRVLRRISRAEGPERIEPEWWRHLGSGEGGEEMPRVRDYYRIEDQTGARYWIFREGRYRAEDAGLHSDDEKCGSEGRSGADCGGIMIDENTGAHEEQKYYERLPAWFMHGLFS